MHTLSQAKVKVITSSFQHSIHLTSKSFVFLALKDVILTRPVACAIQRLCSLLVRCSQVLFLPCVSSFKVASLFHQPHGFYNFSYLTGSSFYQHLYVFNAMFNPSVDIYHALMGKDRSKPCKDGARLCLHATLLAPIHSLNWS